MAGAYLLWNNGDSSLFFDVVITETHEKTNTITEHPVESGADITDHVRPNLDRISLEGFISNTPIYGGKNDQIVLTIPDPPGFSAISLGGALDSLAGAVKRLFSNKAHIVANVMDFPDGQDFVSTTLSTLDELRTKAVLVSVFTSSRIYDNMLIESCDVNRSADDGTGATFNVDFREIRTVQSSVVNAPTPTVPRGQAKQNKGAQAAVEPPQRRRDLLGAIVAGLSK